MSTIREDIIRILFDIDSNPLDDLTRNARNSSNVLTKFGGTATKAVGKLGTAAAGAAIEVAKIGAKATIAGIAAASAAVGKLTYEAVQAYGEMEQNLSGAEAVFGSLADGTIAKGFNELTAEVQHYNKETGEAYTTVESLASISADAYKTMGVSQSDYLATANKMGSLFQGSGLDQQRALDLTTQAMQRAADVASIMGIDQSVALESITGAAKGNLTMINFYYQSAA